MAEWKPFYQHTGKDGNARWTTEEPEDATEPVEGKATAKYAFLVRYKKSYDTFRKYDIDSVVIQSPLLKKQLGIGLHDYPGVTTGLDRLIFKAPFRPFVHRWQRLTALLESREQQNTEAIEHLKLFLDLLYTELQQAIDAKLDLVRNGVMRFDYLWTIFEPQTLVYGDEYGQPRVWELVHTTDRTTQEGVPYLALTVWAVDFDGSRFGRANGNLAVYYFEGTAKITDLPYAPLEYDPHKRETVQSLIARGRGFAALAG